MLKNMKIKFAMILEHTVAVGIAFLLVIACLGAISTQQSSFDQIMDTYVHAQTQVIECRLHANLIARDLRESALIPGSAENLRPDITMNMEELIEHAEALEAIDPTEDGSVADYVGAVREWTAEAEKILDALDRGNAAEAKTLISSSCSPKLREMAATGATVEGTLGRLVEEARGKQETVNGYTILIMTTAMVVACVAVIFLAFRIIRSITRPVEEVRAALLGFSQGKLDIPVNYESKNELGDMCVALRSSQETLADVIRDECYLLEEMAKGNFDIRSVVGDQRYVGELSSIIQSIRKINHNLSDTLAQLLQNAEQVAAGADQVSTGAQSLAQGATEQASAVEELSATIADIANNARKNAENSQLAMDHSQSAGQQVSESAQHMEEMVGAMDRISSSSEEIGKIIATIENIAFQTNILALNAAVEAARAGSAGKGFAVVADEVRNLASKSDQAAKATKELIENSINSVKEGNDIVKSVSLSLEKTVQYAGQVLEDVKLISAAAAEESESIAQVTEGVDQISSVVQTNSATSEESAAASEELSGQAAIMKELMERFKLRDSGASAPARAATYESAPAPAAAPQRTDAFSKY